MNSSVDSLVLWMPRVAGLLVAAFLALFALDAFEGRSFLAALPHLAIHLIPSLMVLAILAAAWRAEWFGAAAFLAVAVGYAQMVGWRLDWVAVISGPLVVVAALFFLSWRRRADAGSRLGHAHGRPRQY